MHVLLSAKKSDWCSQWISVRKRSYTVVNLDWHCKIGCKRGRSSIEGMSNDRALMKVFCDACEKCKSISQWKIQDWEQIRDWERQRVSNITHVVNCLSSDQMTIFWQASSLKEGLDKLNLSFRFDREVLEKVELSQDNDWARTALELIIFFQAVGFITSDNTDIDFGGAADLFRCWFKIGPIRKDLDDIFSSKSFGTKSPFKGNNEGWNIFSIYIKYFNSTNLSFAEWFTAPRFQQQIYEKYSNNKQHLYKKYSNNKQHLYKKYSDSKIISFTTPPPY